MTTYQKASDEDIARLEEMMNAYLIESKSKMTLDELLLSVNVFLPTRDENGVIQGFVGYDSVRSTHFGKVAVWRVIYTEPSCRGKFAEIFTKILKFFLSQGYEHIESHLNHKMNHFYRRKLKSQSDLYVHFGRVSDYIERLEDEK